MYYLFPFHLIPQKSNILLYGAGKAGMNYAQQIEATNYCNVIAVVDKNYKTAVVRNYNVISIESIEDYSFDYICITLLDEKIRNEIKLLLLKKGIPEEKIVSYVSPVLDWDNPNRGFFSQKEEYELTKVVGDYLEKINPKYLITSDRIDVMVRYLVFKDIIDGIDYKEHLSLFSRFVIARTGGVESPSYFSGDGKISVEEYIEKGKRLCENIKNNGFNPEKFIPLGNDRKAYDGLHRIAACLAAGEDMYVKYYGNKDASNCDMEWFVNQGFSQNDRIRIVRAFSDMYPGNCAIFVLWAPFKNLWDFIEAQIKLNFKVIDVLDFDYSDNYIAFENVLRQIYWDWNHYSEWLTRKLDILSVAELKYRIIVVSDERGNKEFYTEVENLKKNLRTALTMDVDKNVPIQLHSTANAEEFSHLKKIFLSANQYNWQMRMIKTYYRTKFLDDLEYVKRICFERHVSMDDICIVGSAVLELFGIRECNSEINFIVKSAHKKRFADEKDDMRFEVKEIYALDENFFPIQNDIIICNNEYHFVFSDLKFINPEFVIRYKKNRGHEKDKLDIIKYESWYRLVMGMEDRKYLNQLVEKELYKRGLR